MAIFGLMFLGMLVATLSIPFADPKTAHEAKGIWLMVAGGALWTAMAGGAFGYVVAVSAAYEVDELGFTRRGQRYAWAEVVNYRQSGGQNGSYVLRFADGRKREIVFSMLQNGSALKEWIDENVAPNIGKHHPARDTIQSGAAQAGIAIFVSVLTLLFFGGGGILAITDPSLRTQGSGSDPTGLGVFCIAISVGVVLLALVGSTRRVTLTEERIVYRTVFRRQEVALGDIRTIRLREVSGKTTQETMRLEFGEDQKILLTSGLDTEYARLRDALLQRCSHAQIVDERKSA